MSTVCCCCCCCYNVQVQLALVVPLEFRDSLVLLGSKVNEVKQVTSDESVTQVNKVK